MDKEKVLCCLSKGLNVDLQKIKDLPTNADLSEIGMSSLVLVSFIVQLEAEFNIEILDSDLVYAKFSTLDGIYATLSKYIPDTPAKKVLILDADNVLWKGICGEGKIEIDEEVVAFQNKLAELYDKGVLLCICSKNEPQNVAEAFRDERMCLTNKNFVAVVANFQDKGTNILELSAALNLSVDSFIFVDDSPYELGYITKALPDITCILFSYKTINTILSEWFGGDKINQSPNRTVLYKEQLQREKARKPLLSIDEYNESIGTVVDCYIAKQEDAERLTELSERAHQFNLSDRHYSLSEMEERISSKDYTVFALSAKDVYGDMGIVGLAVLTQNMIEAFMISCRVFERNFEELILNRIRQEVSGALRGVFKDNGKNARFKDFFNNHGIETV